MWVLFIGILVLGSITALYGYYQHQKTRKQFERGEIAEMPPAYVEPEEEECCGSHATCEKDSLLAAVSKEIEYYEDEELDTWRNTPSNQYSDEAVEEFRHVFYTLQDIEVAGWIRSLHLRQIELPDDIRDEVLLVVGERRIH